MARVVYGEMITSAVGSVGGTTHSKNRYGFYIKNKAIPTNPNSPAQAEIRSIMTQLVARWKSTLTQAQADAWNHAGELHKRSKYGQGFSLSGFNLFCGVNVLRGLIPVAPVDTPSIFEGAPGVIMPTIGENVGTGKMDITAWTDAEVMHYIFIYSTNAVPVTTSYKNAPFVFRTWLSTITPLPVVVDVAYPGSGEPYKIFVGMKVMDSRGAVSEMLYTDYSGTVV